MTVVSPSWRDLRLDATRRLRGVGDGDPEQEARWIVEEAAGLRGTALIAEEHASAPHVAVARVDTMVARRVRGEPLQYVLGSWSFRGLDLFVDPRVLVPRPETEVTAEVALRELMRWGARRGSRSAWSGTTTSYAVADLGTGSGALALALAAELPDAEVWATDVSAHALAVARANLAGQGSAATRVRLAQGDWYAALPSQLRGQLQLIVSNPPYVAESELSDLESEVVDHEPVGALVSGPTGLEAIARIIEGAQEWLRGDGVLVVELDPRRAREATEVALAAGFAETELIPDLTSRDRVLVARRIPVSSTPGGR
jgi:release factor glutamine methyltransferase